MRRNRSFGAGKISISAFGLAGFGLALCLLASAAAAVPLEYGIKAAYLLKFVSFVDWPIEANLPPGAQLSLCVVGHDPFGGALDDVAKQGIDGRTVIVRRLPMISKGSGCQVAYVGGSSRQSVSNALKVLRGEPSLTITEGMDVSGGIVQFVVQDNRVRFAIDKSAADRNGLAISAKLLNLAVAVRGGPTP